MKTDRDVDECGCAPSESERRILWPSVSRRSALGFGALGIASIAALTGPFIAPAFAADYPSWDDVVRAKSNQAAKAAQVTKIEGLIKALADDVALKNSLAEQASAAFFEAQQAYFDAAQKAEQLQTAADAEATKAADAADKAGRIAAQLYRNGGDDTSLELFFSGSAAGADDLLARLGTMDKLIERNNDVYAEAITARDSAQSLTDQAVVAREERDRLQQVAEQKMQEAQAAAEAAQAALAAQQQHLTELEAQLAALKDTTARTVSQYREGVRIREEAARRAREEAERKAREEAAAGGGGGGSVSPGGWARPSGGVRSSGYGYRTVQCGPSYCSSGYHYGVDLAPGCSAGIYAAHAGTVVYVGYNGGYGNYIKIDHGGGIATGYAHIRPGGFFVGNGQWVNAGQLIASIGRTGNAFGCHLHFETYVNGFPVNPTTFMAARGVSV